MSEMTEIDFICRCPCCENKTMYRWVHSNCSYGSQGETINADAIIKCKGCNTSGVILDWKFKCKNHDYKECSKQGAGDALSCILNIKGIPKSFKKKLTLWIAENLEDD